MVTAPSRKPTAGAAPARAPLRQATLEAGPAGSQTARIVDSITAAIVERRLMPGTKLAEQRLADIYAVSRTLVRQALNQLWWPFWRWRIRGALRWRGIQALAVSLRRAVQMAFSSGG